MKAVAAAMVLAMSMSPPAAAAIAHWDPPHASPARIFTGNALKELDAAAPGSFQVLAAAGAALSARRAAAARAETDPYTILLAGLGLLAYMVRRRNSALHGS
jgi:hypothetical protein